MTERRGEITAYLSLIFILLVTFVGALMESASLQLAKNYRRSDMVRAAECIFAEYQKELLEEYEIFALEAGYETGVYEEAKIFDRLEYYGAGNMEQEIARVQMLTDKGCAAFYDQVAAYMEHKYGLDMVKGMSGKTDVWKQQEEKIEEYTETERQMQGELTGLLEENGGELPKEENPIEHVNGLKSSPLLELVTPKEMQLSQKSLVLGETLSHRSRNQGYGDFLNEEASTGTLSELLFGEYVMEHFSAAADEEHSGVLDYQVEYILEGKGSDRENLEAVVKKLLLLRFVVNYAYIQTDEAMKGEAEALALTLCSLLAVPAITQAAAQAILLAWAYGESIVDIRALLAGNRVAFIKSKDSWQLSLSSLLSLGTAEDNSDGADAQNGVSYTDYLKILLFLEKRETAGIRTLDLIEQNLRSEQGQSYFHADQCISRIEFRSTCNLRRGVTYQFPTYFGYN